MLSGVFLDLGRAFWRALLRFNTPVNWSFSSHVALSMMFALFPFMIFVLAVAGMVSSDIQSKDIVYLIFGSWPTEIAQPIEKEVQAVLDQSGKSTITYGAILTVFFASNGVNAIRLALTAQYRAEDSRPFWMTRGLCILFVLLGAVLVAVAALLFIELPFYVDLVSANLLGLASQFVGSGWLRWSLMVALLYFGVYACHAWLPGVRRSNRTIFPGVVLTLILWTFAAQFFAYYLSTTTTYSITYAGLAGVMSALVFLYLMSAILVFGAGFNHELASRQSNLDDQ
jgi:membrane protein